jgi:hypothetical protein
MMMMMSISPFGPVGCGQPLRGVRRINTNHTHPSYGRGFLAIHFVKVKWYRDRGLLKSHSRYNLSFGRLFQCTEYSVWWVVMGMQQGTSGV